MHKLYLIFIFCICVFLKFKFIWIHNCKCTLLCIKCILWAKIRNYTHKPKIIYKLKVTNQEIKNICQDCVFAVNYRKCNKRNACTTALNRILVMRNDLHEDFCSAAFLENSHAEVVFLTSVTPLERLLLHKMLFYLIFFFSNSLKAHQAPSYRVWIPPYPGSSCSSLEYIISLLRCKNCLENEENETVCANDWIQ